MPKRSAKASASSTESLSELAYQLIREKILRGRYPMGAVLSRRQLATELRMSFVPVSEALQHLELDGLVESKPRVGTRVRVPTRDDVSERYGLREALETQAARLCVENADESSKQELLRMSHHLDQLYSSIDGGDDDFLYSVHTYHMRFHQRVAEIGGNNLLRRAIEREQVLVFNWLFDTAAQQKDLPPHFHSELASALAGRSVEAADRAIRAHIRYGMDRILNLTHPADPDNGWRAPRNGGARGSSKRSQHTALDSLP